MSRLLEAAQDKPADLTKAETTLQELFAERERALRVRSQLQAELQEARGALSTAEVKAGDAEAKARIDGNKADEKALEAARKNLVNVRDNVERLEGTDRGLKRKLDDLRAKVGEAKTTLEQAEGHFRLALMEAFSQDFDEVVAHLDPVWREGFALNEYLGLLGRTLDVSIMHPKTHRNALPVNMPSLHDENRTPTNADADQVRKVLRELIQLKRLADILDEPDVETEIEEAEPLPAA